MCSARVCASARHVISPVCASARYVIIPPHPTHPTHPGQAIPIFGRKWPQIVVASDRMHFWVLLALSAKVTFCGRKWPHFVVTSDPNPVFCLWSQVTGFYGRKWPPCPVGWSSNMDLDIGMKFIFCTCETIYRFIIYDRTTGLRKFRGLARFYLRLEASHRKVCEVSSVTPSATLEPLNIPLILQGLVESQSWSFSNPGHKESWDSWVDMQ